MDFVRFLILPNGSEKRKTAHPASTGKICVPGSGSCKRFERFGFHSGRDTRKFDGFDYWKSQNGLAVFTADHINAFMSCEVTDYIDLGTHGMFICEVTQAVSLSDEETMTYSYYHKNVKPKKNPNKKSGYVCKICGYVHESDTLPDDFVCPICKHGASDFEKL